MGSADGITPEIKFNDPHKILELAKLCKAEAQDYGDYVEYVYYLRCFFGSPEVERVVRKLREHRDIADEDGNLIRDIVEAGISLCIYFTNDSSIYGRDMFGFYCAVVGAIVRSGKLGRIMDGFCSDALRRCMQEGEWSYEL